MQEGIYDKFVEKTLAMAKARKVGHPEAEDTGAWLWLWLGL